MILDFFDCFGNNTKSSEASSWNHDRDVRHLHGYRKRHDSEVGLQHGRGPRPNPVLARYTSGRFRAHIPQQALERKFKSTFTKIYRFTSALMLFQYCEDIDIRVLMSNGYGSQNRRYLPKGCPFDTPSHARRKSKFGMDMVASR